MRLSGYGTDIPPDPIPNSAVKACCADGTMSRHGRVGRCLVFQPHETHRSKSPTLPIPERLSDSGFFPFPQQSSVWRGVSSPVARQAHNPKVAGSNPAP